MKPTKHERQLMALVRAARKYPSAKGKIRQIKEKKRLNDWLSQ